MSKPHETSDGPRGVSRREREHVKDDRARAHARPRGRERTRPRAEPHLGGRAVRLEELYRKELNSLLDGEIGDARLDGARVNRIELSRDGSRARVWFAMNDAARVNHAEAARAFERAAGFFRRRLSDAVPLKRSPELSFRHDPVSNGTVALPPEDIDS